MADEPTRERSLSDFGDLDCEASDYATAWMTSDAKLRRSLRDDLVRRPIPFADQLASRYRQRNEPLDDIRQVARLGLVKAVDRTRDCLTQAQIGAEFGI